MAPQKTMVVSQPQSGFVDQSSNSQVAIVTAKPRKRKSKQQQQQPQAQQPKAPVEHVVEQQQQLPKSSATTALDPRPNATLEPTNKQQKSMTIDIPANTNCQQESQQKQPVTKSSKSTSSNKQQPTRQQQPQTVVACERASVVARQQQQKQTDNKVPTTVPKQQVQTNSSSKTKQFSGEQRRPSATSVAPQQSVVPASLIGKQISVDETDDIDAGIELDGSSNSGSSVKDINEDSQTTKSASVSPVMAQSNLVTNSGRSAAKHAMEIAPVEQLTGSMCTEMAPKSKKAAATKQQLAADQLVIDADEEQLQKKLISKQPKQNQDNIAPSSTTTSATAGATGAQLKGASGKTKASLSSLTMPNSQPAAATTSSDNNNQVTTPQSPALCKVCEQHVYQMERMLAEKSVYHKKCFRCQQCNIQLRVDNYSSHEGQLYCKVHHRQLLQPQAKLNSEDDVDIVAKSTYKQVDNYLLQRGRLSELSLSFLNQTSEGLRQRQMIICENEPAELPKDVVRSDTKVDDGFEQLNLNLKDIAQRFERGTASNGDDSQPSSAGVVVEKPSVSIKKTLLAFESRGSGDASSNDETKRVTERPVVRKLTNLNGFLERQNSSGHDGNDSSQTVPKNKPLAVRRSESLMLRLKKYESRIAGEQVNDDDDDDDDNDDGAVSNDDENNNRDGTNNRKKTSGENHVPKKLTSFDLSSLKSQWENGDISKRRQLDDDLETTTNDATGGESNNSINCNGNSPQYEKSEELHRIRQQLARKKLGESGNVRNIYENAIKEREQLQKQEAKRNQTSDLPAALNRFSTTEIQKQLLQQQNGSQNDSQTVRNQLPNKDHFQLNLSKKANKLKEKFELGLINNDSRDDSDQSDCEDGPVLSKLEQIRQEKMEDLSIFTEGEIGAREARNMFQQIDRRLSAGATNGTGTISNNRGSQVSSFRSTLRSQQSQESQVKPTATTTTTNSQDRPQRHNNIINNSSINNNNPINNEQQPSSLAPENQPIRLTNNIVSPNSFMNNSAQDTQASDDNRIA